MANEPTVNSTGNATSLKGRAVGEGARSAPDAPVGSEPAHFAGGESQSRGWLIGLIVILTIGVVGIGAQAYLLRKAVSLEAEKAAWQATSEQRVKEQGRMDSSIAESRATLDKMKADAGIAEQELAKKQTIMAELEAARKEAAIAKQEAINATAERDRMVVAKTNAEREQSDLNAKIASATGVKDQLEKQRDGLLKEVAAGQTQLKDVKDNLVEMAKMEAQAEMLKRETAQLTARRDALQTETGNAEKLKAEVQGESGKLATLRGQKAAVEQRIADLKREQQGLEDQKKLSETAAADAQKGEQGAVTKAAVAKKRCDDLEQEKTAAEAKLRDLSKTLAGVEGELRAKQVLLDQLKDIEMRVEQRRTELRTLEDNIARARAALNEPQPGNTAPKAPADERKQP